MKNWEEIKVAYKVALLGTVSAAAEDLGVHRATVIRHINSLEESLATKLFVRHASGYTPTENGRVLLRVAKATNEQFSDLKNTLLGRQSKLEGELIITSMDALRWMIMPIIANFKIDHSKIVAKYVNSNSSLRLDYGEAHIAFRVGEKPSGSSNIVQKLRPYQLGLFASKSYIKRKSMPSGIHEFGEHKFVVRRGHPTLPYQARLNLPFEEWLDSVIVPENVSIEVNTPATLDQAIEDGLGIGFYPIHKAAKNRNLVEVMARQESWQFPIWLVTHKDLHFSPKVQAFIDLVRTQGLLV